MPLQFDCRFILQVVLLKMSVFKFYPFAGFDCWADDLNVMFYGRVVANLVPQKIQKI